MAARESVELSEWVRVPLATQDVQHSMLNNAKLGEASPLPEWFKYLPINLDLIDIFGIIQLWQDNLRQYTKKAGSGIWVG